MATELHAVVLYPGKQKLAAVVRDGGGKVRRIEYGWMAKEATDVPPASWWTAVCAEVEQARTRDLEAATGRRPV